MSTQDKIYALESLIRDEQSNADLHRVDRFNVDQFTREDMLHDALHEKHLNRVKVLLEARDALQIVEEVRGVLPL